MPNEPNEPSKSTYTTIRLFDAIHSMARKAGTSTEAEDAEQYANACLTLVQALVALKQAGWVHGAVWYDAAK